MRIATWNVNSVRRRLQRLVNFLDRHQPDICCLQELKCTAEQFPYDVLERAGYHAAVAGQKTYNGVAILSRTFPDDIRRGLGDDTDDPQARLVAAHMDGLRVMSIYVPNGATVGSETFSYKLDWLGRLRAMLDAHHDPGERLVICGDTNVIRDGADAENPAAWAETVLAVPPVREAFDRLLDWGLVDVFRQQHPGGHLYSWWDYRNLGFPRNDGLRLDHVLATQTVAADCSAAFADRDERKGTTDDKPSDHCPVVVDFDM
ncbi:MAG: exodeoxyribonuclease III [Phycisphaerae bacterium]|nr:exodeoxyribonuclease III [Phycisphaerae bacterium]